MRLCLCGRVLKAFQNTGIKQLTGVADIGRFGCLVAEPRKKESTVISRVKFTAESAVITASVIITDVHFRAVTVIHATFATLGEIRECGRYTVSVISDFLGDG